MSNLLLSQRPEILEYTASDGTVSSLVLKFGGVLSFLFGAFIAINAIASFGGGSSTSSSSFDETGLSARQIRLYVLLIGFTLAGSAFLAGAILFGFAVVIDNVVATRKNSQHLAAVRFQMTKA